MASFARIAVHSLIWRKIMMSEHSCRSVCGYYDANAEFRNSGNNTFKKYCKICDLELISKYSSCPCCHKSFEEIGV
ncbi:hypothetical protein NSED_02110 [Candidatus Nitrosopumilus sediminis]|uniref:Uncharacterized protein n=2 Tax=Candidatus Nitrosopumilus sediminis TaxID=1229909 RepID=K0BAW8_9ARCH|nr:hypothetical protein NSED_02110 [Candidatus Nitrosopumilus sediminis]